MSRSMHQRNAASVLPEPVGARMRVESPRAIAGQPWSCGLVGVREHGLKPTADGRMEQIQARWEQLAPDFASRLGPFFRLCGHTV